MCVHVQSMFNNNTFLYVCQSRTKKINDNTLFLFSSQSSSNVAEQAKKVAVNHPYIGIIACTDSLSFSVVTETLLVLTTGSFFKAFQGMMACFYVFNIEYPKALSIPITFILHFISSIKEENLPPTVVRIISSVDKLED